MSIQYDGHTFMTDDDLRVRILGFWPNVPIKNSELLKIFQQETGRDFLGGDELVSYAQPLVSRGMDFAALEEEILADAKNPEKPGLIELISKKTATGIGRGHSLGGLSGVVLGIHGTKMIDSGLTGLVASRSLVTSSRRRETTAEEIVIPQALIGKDELLKEYLSLSREVLSLSEQFKERFKGNYPVRKSIQTEINALGFNPIQNLSGHGLGKGLIHASPTIPNIDNKDPKKIEDNAHIHAKELEGRTLTVNEARPMTERPPRRDRTSSASGG